MLLITMYCWFGPSSEARSRAANYDGVPPKLQTVIENEETYATNLPLDKALNHIRDYQKAYNTRYVKVTCTEFRIKSVQKIQQISEDHLDFFQTRLVEQLPITPEEF